MLVPGSPGVYDPKVGVTLSEKFSGELEEGAFLSVACVTELSVTHPESFEAAISEGVNHATLTLHNMKSA